jgi:hypothetical protein
VITEYPPEEMVCNRNYLCIARSEKTCLCAELLAASPGVRPQDLLINLVEVSWENWLFGNGEGQYMDT